MLLLHKKLKLHISASSTISLPQPDTWNIQGCGVIRRYGLPDGRLMTEKPLGKSLLASSSFSVGSNMHSPPA
jgi:hypothetical protein